MKGPYITQLMLALMCAVAAACITQYALKFWFDTSQLVFPYPYLWLSAGVGLLILLLLFPLPAKRRCRLSRERP